MYLRTLFLVLALGALALFTAANWSAFIAPTTLSVIFATIEAPLGLVLLSVVVLLTALFLIYVVYLQSSVLFETRRHARELHAQRELAEHAEISRFHDLRSSLEAQLQTLGKQTEQAQNRTVGPFGPDRGTPAPVDRAMPKLVGGVDRRDR